MKINHCRAIALLCLFAYLFHIVRNLTSIYYAILAGLILALTLAIICNKTAARHAVNRLTLLMLLSWIWASGATIMASFEYGSPDIGLFRLWASFPIIVICSLIASAASIKNAFLAINVFFAVSALSLILQLFIGPISWFAESSERAGGVRFASLVGSLTAYGVMVGVPMLGSLYFHRLRAGLILFIIYIAGALISVQKAAMLNIIIALVFAWWLRLLPATAILKALPFGGAIALLLFHLLSNNADLQNIIDYALGTFTSDTQLTGDYSVSVSMLHRLTELPAEAIRFFDYSALILGAGAFGASGVLGYPEIPMAHNGLIEILLVFGYVVGAGIAAAMIYGLLKALKFLSNRRGAAASELGFLWACYLIWLINYLFSGGGLFHPVGSTIFWLIVLRIYFLTKLLHPNQHTEAKRT